MVNLIMVAKVLNTIVRQPMTDSMDQMMEQMVQMVAPVKTTAWGGLHGHLALVLNDIYMLLSHARLSSRTTTLFNHRWSIQPSKHQKCKTR
jgi:hypothetical protein